METATQQLLNLARAAQDCTDYRVGKLMGVSTSAVSKWRTGSGHMSTANIVAACKLAGIKDVFRWQMFIGAEREKAGDGDFYREVRDDFRAIESGMQPKEGGWLSTLIHGLPKHIPGIVLACAGAFAALHSPTAAAFSAESQSPAPVDLRIHYAKYARRRARRPRPLLEWLRTVFPALDPCDPAAA